MQVHDIVAVIVPNDAPGSTWALDAVKDHRNRDLFCSAQPEDDSTAKEPYTSVGHVVNEILTPTQLFALGGLPISILRFSHTRKHKYGFIFGAHPDSDFVLPQVEGVSQAHFSINFDRDGDVIARDLHTEAGTCITYDDKSGWAPKSGTVWKLRGPRHKANGPTVIEVVKGLSFHVFVMPERLGADEHYVSNIKHFSSTTCVPLDKASVNSSDGPLMFETILTATPKPVYWERPIAEGGFGRVSFAWDVCSGEEYAVKRAKLPDIGLLPEGKEIAEQMLEWQNEECQRRVTAFKKEIARLKQLSHPNIVRMRHSFFDVVPQIYFEYLPCGTLSTCPASIHQIRQIAVQLLDSVQYMHGKGLAHRDLKPANILVGSWTNEKVHVKLADLGLAKELSCLKTRCGTTWYMAPK